jgi:hypothetical protein
MAIAYTETTIETAFRVRLGDPAGNPAQRWSSAECIDLLNAGAAQLVLDIPNSLQTQWEVDTVDGTREYLLPVDWIRGGRVEYEVDATNNDDDRLLTYLDAKQWEQAGFTRNKSNTGDPQFYTYSRKLGDISGAGVQVPQPNHIILEPAPNAALKLRVHGWKLMQTLVAAESDVPELATPKLESIFFWGCHIAFMGDDDGQRSREALQNYQLQVQKIRDFMLEEDFSRAPRLKPWFADEDVARPVIPWHRRVT